MGLEVSDLRKAIRVMAALVEYFRILRQTCRDGQLCISEKLKLLSQPKIFAAWFATTISGKIDQPAFSWKDLRRLLPSCGQFDSRSINDHQCVCEDSFRVAREKTLSAPMTIIAPSPPVPFHLVET